MVFAVPGHNVLGAALVDMILARDLDALGVGPRPLGPDGGEGPAEAAALARGGPGLAVGAVRLALRAPRDGGAGEVLLEKGPEPRQAVAHDAQIQLGRRPNARLGLVVREVGQRRQLLDDDGAADRGDNGASCAWSAPCRPAIPACKVATHPDPMPKIIPTMSFCRIGMFKL